MFCQIKLNFYHRLFINIFILKSALEWFYLLFAIILMMIDLMFFRSKIFTESYRILIPWKAQIVFLINFRSNLYFPVLVLKLRIHFIRLTIEKERTSSKLRCIMRTILFIHSWNLIQLWFDPAFDFTVVCWVIFAFLSLYNLICSSLRTHYWN